MNENGMLIQLDSARASGSAAVESRVSNIPATYVHDLSVLPPSVVGTPFRHFMQSTTDEAFRATAPLLEKLNRPVLAVSVCYNMKTSPMAPILSKVKGSGFLIGCTSGPEQEKSGEIGFARSAMVLSGPAKDYLPRRVQERPVEGDGPVEALFCDSLAELRHYVELVKTRRPVAKYLGVLVRCAEYRSRFGVPICFQEPMDELCKLLGELPPEQRVGLQFRAASSKTGLQLWYWLACGFIGWAAKIRERTGRPISCISLGGGWFPDDWKIAMEGPIAEVIKKISETLPNTSFAILEVGKAFAQPAASLVTRVLEIRRSPLPEILVDGSIAELPDIHSFPHRIAWRSSRDLLWRSLPDGGGCILGRLPIETDILATRIAIPDGLEAGDLLAFCDAGAYDTSMALSFGAGRIAADPYAVGPDPRKDAPQSVNSRGKWFSLRKS